MDDKYVNKVIRDFEQAVRATYVALRDAGKTHEEAERIVVDAMVGDHARGYAQSLCLLVECERQVAAQASMN